MVPEQEQETQVKKFFYVALLLLLGGNFCFALEAKFSKEHACVPAGEHIASCEIRHGDSLSKDALAVYGDWHLYSVIKDANPQITDANKIYEDARIMIPDVPSAKPSVTVKAGTETTSSATPAASIQSVLGVHVQDVPPANALTVFTMDMEDQSSATPVAAMFAAYYHAPAVRLASEPTQTQTAEPATSPESAPAPTSAQAVKAKPATFSGYRLTIPQDVAVAMGGIPLKCPLKTEILSYASENAKIHNVPAGYSHLKDSFAQKEGDNIVLYVPKGLPTEKPFNLFVAGIHDPIDGNAFMANAEPFQGKFPGPHRAGRRIFSGLMLGANGYMMATTLGPIAGPSVMCGMLIVREVMKRHAESSLKKAEDHYNATLAGGNTPSKEKESGQ